MPSHVIPSNATSGCVSPPFKKTDLELAAEKAENLNVAKIAAARSSFWVNVAGSAAMVLGLATAVIAFFSGACVVVVVLAAVRLTITVADAVCSHIEYDRQIHGKEGLPMGGDSIGNLTYAILRCFDVDKARAKEYATFTTLAVAFGLMMGSAAAVPLCLIGVTLPSQQWYIGYVQPMIGIVATMADTTTWVYFRNRVHKLEVELAGINAALETDDRLRLDAEVLATATLISIRRGRRLSFDTLNTTPIWERTIREARSRLMQEQGLAR